MTKEEKVQVVEELKEKLSASSNFYITDASGLTVAQVNALRGLCFEKEIDFKVYKNTLVKKAMEADEDSGKYEELFNSLKGPTALMFTEVANSPAKIIEQFREKNEKPVLKAAYIDTAVFIGDDSVKELSKMKSKEELLGELVGLLQSPMKNVIGALKSGGDTLGGLVKTLQEREGGAE